MKKYIAIFLALVLAVILAGCGDNSPQKVTEEDESTTESIPLSIVTEDDSSVSSAGSISIEDYSSEYVEPTFKVVYTFAETLTYFDAESDDTVKNETDSDGKVTSVITTDSDGKIKGEVTVSYKDDALVSAVIFYENGEATGERIVFSFYDEDSINIIAHSAADSSISLYLYNRDGSFNSYIDSAGFSTMLAGAVMSGLADSLAQ